MGSRGRACRPVVVICRQITGVGQALPLLHLSEYSAFGDFEQSDNLFALYSRKANQEIIDGVAGFKVLEKSLYGHAGTGKDRSTPHHLWRSRNQGSVHIGQSSEKGASGQAGRRTSAKNRSWLSSPKGAAYQSPGQRPGSNGPSPFQAASPEGAKYRFLICAGLRRSDHIAPLQGLYCGPNPLTQAAGLGFDISPLWGFILNPDSLPRLCYNR